ncbi:ABC transporter ATP-binding protein [Bacillus cereus]|uniref:ABC transporter ATP-binding protein n=1 Tax=Bacillus cereus TaxID=1396 RepID=A0A9X6VME7_BACCE|nr:ABC transporter ATP-binding protein [Bacillus cereus]PFB31337.1 ABC transporter ATP-binding protein [Bacillus cereus]PFC11801.1 ABC transporter ATP-binding protein [Bacillus cereus]PFD22343.1 ABC transporter ATP-binding protein [Bacillus cereus]PFL61423.1 ABC transporter ATP-binding protein [Bacillus cereus]PGW63535.1 ABC transporter ATP-binding protein [Bacillus cereus]
MKKPIIATSNLCKSFSMGKEKLDVINNLNLEIYEGDFTIIMGSSGAGKSTLLYALSTMDKYSDGKVKLLGRDITSFSEDQIANIRKNEIAFIFQGINLLPDMNLIENVAYNGYGKLKSKKSVNEKALSLLKKLGLENDTYKYPSEVSGGQKQRTAIARALINEPKIIFADEPTGALNSSMGNIVLDILTQLNNEGQSIVMVTHDIKAATRGNRIVYLKDGRTDGELSLDKFGVGNLKEREEFVYKFLKDRNW